MTALRNDEAGRRRSSIQEILQDSHKVDPKTIQEILDTIDAVSTKRVNEGFNKRNFSLGVMNTLLLTFVFGRYPQHFWALYLLELALLMPGRIYGSCKSKPLNKILYYCDYCWIMNYSGVLVLVQLALKQLWEINDELRYHMFATAFGVTCGPLLGSAMILSFVSLVFHDFKALTGLFIHILPPITMYTVRWHANEITQAWPSVFKLDYLDNVPFTPEGRFFVLPGRDLGTIAGNAVALYLLWFIPYVSWMLLIGLDLPRKNRRNKDGTLIVPKYDTVFHNTVRFGLVASVGKAAWGRPVETSKKQMENDDYEVRDFLLYMMIHFSLAYLAVYVLAYPCYSSQSIHAALLVLTIFICVQRGASRYTYYVTTMYGSMVRKDYADVLTNW